MEDDPGRSGPSWMAAIVLVALAMVLVGGWLLFPRLSAYMHRQDCIAAGHVNCGD